MEKKRTGEQLLFLVMNKTNKWKKGMENRVREKWRHSKNWDEQTNKNDADSRQNLRHKNKWTQLIMIIYFSWKNINVSFHSSHVSLIAMTTAFPRNWKKKIPAQESVYTVVCFRCWSNAVKRKTFIATINKNIDIYWNDTIEYRFISHFLRKVNKIHGVAI